MSVRSTSVLTKNPTNSSSALSVRPAIGLPIAHPSPLPAGSAALPNPARNTMNKLAPLSRASVSSARCNEPRCAAQPHRRDGSTLPAESGRSAVPADREGPQVFASSTKAAAISHCPGRSPLQNLMLPQRVIRILHRQRRKLRPAVRKPRRIGARQIPPQRHQRPAVTRNMMQHQKQHVPLRAKGKQVRPQRQLMSQIKSAPYRHGKIFGKPRVTHLTHLRPQPAGVPVPVAAEPQACPGIQCEGSRDAPSHRPMPPAGPPDRAIRSAVPPSVCCMSRSAPPADPKTTSGAAQTTAESRSGRGSAAAPAAPPRRRSSCRASASTVGNSNRLRIATSTSSVARMRLISLVANSE